MNDIKITVDYRETASGLTDLLKLHGLPQVGPKLAKRLIRHFKSVSKVMNASVQALTDVDGIGKISAKKIREVLDAEVY